MTLDDFIDIISKSDNKLLASNANELGIWTKIPHNKSGLELFLTHNICEVIFKDKQGTTTKVVACSNKNLIKMFSLKRNSAYEKNIREIMEMKTDGIHSKSSAYVLSWNFLTNDYCKISTAAWRIGKWIGINEENIGILNETLRDILHKDKGDEEK